ncbi:MAG TPA: YceI family protein [Terriglobales bacterium]|nr:YceI family protein [Terriglobales bacterium]
MRKVSVVSFLVLLSALVAVAQAQEFKVDPVHSSAQFKVKHLMVSTVVGRFTDLAGTILYDAQDPAKSRVEAVVKTASIDTENATRDKDLRDNYFEVTKYPEMTFKSTKVEKRGDQWVAIGPLTIKDVTKNIEVPFEVNAVDSPRGKILGASATFKVNRHDYHVNKGGVIDNGAVVGSDIAIELNVEARPPAPAPAAK